MNRSTSQPVAKSPDEQLDDLLSVRDPASEWYLAYQLTDRQVQFLADLAEIRRRTGRLGLTEAQAAWLAAIHARVSRQLRVIAAMAGSTDFRRRCGYVAPEDDRVLPASFASRAGVRT